MFKKKGDKELVYDTTKECISGPLGAFKIQSDTLSLISTKLDGSF